MELLPRLPLKGHIALAASELLKGWVFLQIRLHELQAHAAH